MVKRGIAFFVLLCHMNTSMFLPQVPEQDIYNFAGQQADDINSVLEYIDQVVLGHHDDTPEDEDDDSGQNFHLVKVVDYCFEPFYSSISQRYGTGTKKINFFNFKEDATNLVSFDIILPPPKA